MVQVNFKAYAHFGREPRDTVQHVLIGAFNLSPNVRQRVIQNPI